MSTLIPRLALARAASTTLRTPYLLLRAHAPPRAPGVGCSHWVRGYVTPTNPALKKRAAVEVVDFDDVNGVEFNDAAEIIDAEADVGFCDDVVETEWEGEEVQDGVFVSLDPDAEFKHARHAKAAEAAAAAAAEPKPAAPARKVPTSIKQMNRLLSRHLVPDLPESELDEKFVRGRGPGGQAINKTNSSVCLVHIPTGIRVQAQPTRSREQNRFVARQILKDRLDLMRARGELPHPDESVARSEKEMKEMSRKERLATEARTWSKQELRWEKERRRKLNRKKKISKRKKGEKAEERDEGGAEESGEAERK